MKCLIRATLAVAWAVSVSGCAESNARAPAATPHDDAVTSGTTTTTSTTAPAAQPVDTTTSLTGATVGPRSSPSSVEPPSPSTSPASAELAHDTTARLTDEQIIEIVTVAQAAEDEESKLAKSKAKSARVAHFASDLIMDGRALGAQRSAVARRLDSRAPASSAAGSEVDVERGGYLQSLRASDGASFDRRFVASQVKQNQTMLKLLDEELIPSAKNPDVKDYLRSVRSKTIAHLLAAQEIDNQL